MIDYVGVNQEFVVLSVVVFLREASGMAFIQETSEAQFPAGRRKISPQVNIA